MKGTLERNHIRMGSCTPYTSKKRIHRLDVVCRASTRNNIKNKPNKGREQTLDGGYEPEGRRVDRCKAKGARICLQQAYTNRQAREQGWQINLAAV